MIPNKEALDYTDLTLVQDAVEAGLIVERGFQWEAGRVVPVNMMALRMQYPYMELETLPQGSVVGQVAASGSMRVDVPSGVQILTVNTTGNLLVSIGGSVALPSGAGSWVDSAGGFVLAAGQKRKFGVGAGTTAVNVIAIADAVFSVEFYFQAG